MKKKFIAIILELIPILSAIISFILIVLNYDTDIVRYTIKLTVLLSFVGFIFFFIGRFIEKKDKLVKVLGLFDCFATLYIIIMYIIAIFSFGL